MVKKIRVAKNATLVGDVTLGEGANIWYGAVLRGDHGAIVVGKNTNVQDNCVLHASTTSPIVIGNDVTIGHAAIVHGCTVADGALIGMGAILLNRCVIGAEAMVAAGALVTEGTVVPPGMLAMGSPAKVVRPLREEELAKNRAGTAEYLHLAEQLPFAEEA